MNVSRALVPEPGQLRVRLRCCCRVYSASVGKRIYCVMNSVSIRSTAMGTRVNLARSGRRALLTKSVGSAEYLAEPRLVPRRGSSAWLISYKHCNTPRF